MSSSTSKNNGLLIAGACALIIASGAVLIPFLRAGQDQYMPASVASEQNADLLSLGDIEEIFVHAGFGITCSNEDGFGVQGYVYTVNLTNGRGIIERGGCGLGSPEEYAASIAEDLYANGIFVPLNTQQVMEKLSFKLYEIEEENAESDPS